jgi:hypothetical protein
MPYEKLCHHPFKLQGAIKTNKMVQKSCKEKHFISFHELMYWAASICSPFSPSIHKRFKILHVSLHATL